MEGSVDEPASDDDLEPRFPNRLSELMRAAGLTDPKLAVRVGTTRQSIGRLRRGHAQITPEWAQRLAPHLGVAWQSLFDESPDAISGTQLRAGYGERIRRTRIALGFDEAAFAQLLGITLDTLRVWEREERPPDVYGLVKMHDKANISADWILFRDASALPPRMLQTILDVPEQDQQ
jgi:transcriptional regulator with XRE-family HTH domain